MQTHKAISMQIYQFLREKMLDFYQLKIQQQTCIWLTAFFFPNAGSLMGIFIDSS